jgi:hypothetical protein
MFNVSAAAQPQNIEPPAAVLETHDCIPIIFRIFGMLSEISALLGAGFGHDGDDIFYL